MNNIKQKLLRQHNLGNIIGGAKDLFQRTLFYVTAINFVLLVITVYSVSKFINQISLPIFAVAIFAVLLLAMVIEYKFVLPSSWRFINRQMYKHDNPLLKELGEVEKRLNERLDKIERKLKGGRDNN